MKKIRDLVMVVLMAVVVTLVLTACKGEVKPQVSVYNTKVSYNIVEFDIKINDNGTFINDVIISIAEKENSDVTLSSLTSESGINFSGDTRGIYFNNLELDTGYVITIEVDYTNEGEMSGKKSPIKKFDFQTKKLDSSIRVDLSNISNENGRIQFDYYTAGLNNLSIYLTDSDDIVVNYLTALDGLSPFGSVGCYFAGMRNNTTYKLQFVADVFDAGLLIEDVIVRDYVFTTGTYQYEPEATISNVRLNEDMVVFDCEFKDQFEFLTGLSLIIVDDDENILAELTPLDGLVLGMNRDCYFYGLESETNYTILVIADYETVDTIYTTQTLAKYQFTSEYFDYNPTAEIYGISTEMDEVKFTCIIQDPNDLLVGISVLLLDADGVILQVISPDSGLAIGYNYLSFSGLTGNTSYKIAVMADYLNKAGTMMYYSVILESQSFISDNFVVTYLSTYQDLVNIKDNLSGYYALSNNINLAGKEWIPIGTEKTPFTGVLDGNDYTISNLTITTNSSDYLGLFGYTRGAEIINLKMINVNISVTGKLNQNLCAGAITSYALNNIIKNCEVNGIVNVTARGDGYSYAGGLIGYGSASITNSYNTGGISSLGLSSAYAGGLIGYGSASITNSYNTGDISSSVYSGGLVGYGPIITITNSHNTGDISGSYVGGLVGHGESTITNSYNTGDISSSNSAGGLVGHGYATITNSHNTGAISGSYAGGLAGYTYLTTATISNSYNTGDISSSSYAGGLVGYSSLVTITNSYNTGDISGSYVGGLVGDSSSVTISHSYNTGDISASYYAGGLVGCGSSSITNSYNTGNVTGTGAGGLVGRSQYGTYENCLSLGEVTGDSSGIIVGGHTDSDFINCYYYGITADEANNASLTTISQLNSKSFYTNTLGWSEEVWDLDNLDFANGILPTLR